MKEEKHDYFGEVFLNRVYHTLSLDLQNRYGSRKKFRRTGKVSKEFLNLKIIGTYLQRLETTLELSIKRNNFERLKNILLDKYVIKEEYIPRDKYSESEIKEIINIQEKTLSVWIDYLFYDDCPYPMWIKYWIFRSVVITGNYEAATEKYLRRTKKTLSPFLELNAEALSRVVHQLEEIQSIEGIDTTDAKKLINNEKIKSIVEINFSRLYDTELKKLNQVHIDYGSATDGIWIKYNQGSREDAKKLFDSLQGKNTRWCTAGELSIAEKQLCGPYTISEHGGDFYVYYTKDQEGNYSIPRIAIRLIDNNRIAEISGIKMYENLEEGLEDIVSNKLDSIPNLEEYDKNLALQKIKNLRMISSLYEKTLKGEKLTKDEILFIYPIMNINNFGFGNGTDFRITKLIQKRDELGLLNDDFEIVKNSPQLFSFFAILKSCKINNFKLDNKDEILKYMNMDENIIAYVDKDLLSDRAYIVELIEKGFTKLDLLENYKNDIELWLSIIKVGRKGNVIKQENLLNNIPKKLLNNKEIILSVISLTFYVKISKERSEFISLFIKNNYEDIEFIKSVIKIRPHFAGVLKDIIENDLEYIKILLGTNLDTINYIGNFEIFKNKDMVKLLLSEYPLIYISFFNEKSIVNPNDIELFMSATKLEQAAEIIIEKISYDSFDNEFKKIISEDATIAWKFIKYKPSIIRFISSETYLNIKKLIIDEMECNSNYLNMCNNLKNLFPIDMQEVIEQISEKKKNIFLA